MSHIRKALKSISKHRDMQQGVNISSGRPFGVRRTSLSCIPSWPWESYLVSPTLNFLVCKMGRMELLQDWENMTHTVWLAECLAHTEGITNNDNKPTEEWGTCCCWDWFLASRWFILSSGKALIRHTDMIWVKKWATVPTEVRESRLYSNILTNTWLVAYNNYLRDEWVCYVRLSILESLQKVHGC